MVRLGRGAEWKGRRFGDGNLALESLDLVFVLVGDAQVSRAKPLGVGDRQALQRVPRVLSGNVDVFPPWYPTGIPREQVDAEPDARRDKPSIVSQRVSYRGGG